MNAKQIVSEYMRQVWVEKDVEAAGRYVAPDLIQHTATLPNGLAALKEFLPKLFREIAPASEWRILRVIADGDLVAVHSLMIAAPGARGTVVVDIFRVDSERIVEHWDVAHEVPKTTTSGNAIY